MVKYHVKTPHGVVTRTIRRQLEPQFTHIVVYGGNCGVPGDGKPGQCPTFHGSADLARSAASKWTNAVIYTITESDYTRTGPRPNDENIAGAYKHLRGFNCQIIGDTAHPLECTMIP